jgi:hypothetical protein
MRRHVFVSDEPRRTTSAGADSALRALLSSFRSFFGDPVSTAYVVLLLLLAGMAVGSAGLGGFLALSPGKRRGLALAAALLSAGVVVCLPFQWSLAPWPLRLAIAAAGLLPLGVLLGVFFPLGLRGHPERAVAEAYGFDALGTVMGFLIFPLLALPLGLPAALGAGALGYAAA